MSQSQSMADSGAATQTTTVSQEDQIVQQCRAEFDNGLLFRKDRETAWHLIEDFYFNRVKKSLKSKFNVPVPILPGFVEAWQAKMARHPDLKFDNDENEAEYIAVQKTNAIYVKVRNHDDYDWDMADTDGKKLACLYGRAIYQYAAESKPEYKSNLRPVDVYDYVADPKGGGNIEDHQFRHIDNIFRDREQLKDAVTDKGYNAAQVSKLINATTTDRIINNDNVYRSKQNRFVSLNMNGIIYNYSGQDLFKLIESGTTWKGKRWYVLWNYETGLWVKCVPWKEVFKSNLWDITTWATHRDTFNFWSKSPCDDMVPMAEMIRVLVNQEFDNRNKKNYGQRAYDPDIFPNPAELEWRPDGLVATKAGAAKRIADGIYEFETPELQGTINLVTWIDGMLKEKTGINSEAQGQSDADKVGIAYLNVQQSAERTTLIFESYVKCWQAIGRRFLWGLWEHMRGPMAVKIIGENGATWDELARYEINTDWNIRVDGSDLQAQKDEIKKKALTDLFASMANFPDEIAATSPKWRVRTKLQIAGLDDDDIRAAFDVDDDEDKAILAHASQMIQDCLKGKSYKPFRGATTAFVQKIVDFATDNDLKFAEYQKLMKLAQDHMQIASENAQRKAVSVRASKGMGLPPQPAQPSATEQFANIRQPGQQPPTEQPTPNTPGGTQFNSQQLTNAAPNMGQQMNGQQ